MVGTFAHKQILPYLNPWIPVLNVLSEAAQRQCTGSAILEDLRAAMVAVWKDSPLETIRRSILQRKCRLITVIRSKGGAIVHVYKQNYLEKFEFTAFQSKYDTR